MAGPYPDFEFITLTKQDGIATLTLNRPDKLNAAHPAMRDEIVIAFDHTDADDDVRAVIVTGAGRAFCAGADLGAGGDTFNIKPSEDGPIKPDGSVDYGHVGARDWGGVMVLRMYNSLKPIIGAINGPAVGIGVTMTLPMDFRLASETARFGFVFTRRGIVPEACSSWFLPRLVGIAQALEWCYSGRVFDAEEALRGRLVRSIHAPDDLLPAATAMAREIIDNTAPVSIALTRQQMWRGLGWDHPMMAHRVDSRGILTRGRSADAAEGIASFLEKRAAVYPDRVSSDLPDYFPWWDEPRFG